MHSCGISIAEHWTRSAFVNSIAGKVERLAAGGQFELVERAIATMQSYNAQYPKSAITARHRFWTLADTARAARDQVQASSSKGSETFAAGDGFTVEADHAADRVQIFFDSKPDAASASTRQLLGADSAIE